MAAGGAPEPYAFGLATEQGTKHYLQQRYRLLPYIYSYAWEASRKGLPIVRPLALEFPDDPAAAQVPGDEYMFGREFLVAPVLFEGQSRRKVYFPKGTWVDWDTGYDYAGGQDWVVAAPQNRIPVAVRAGAIIPMAPDMMEMLVEKPWDPLTIEVFPSGRSDFTLYRDDGRTFAYQSGDFTTTRFDCDATSPSAINFTIAESNKRYTPNRYVVRFHLRQTPKTVELDHVRLDPRRWTWDADSRVLTIGAADGASATHAIDVSLEEQPLPARLAPALAAEAIDPKGEVAGSGGEADAPFLPAPALPATLKASNYDNGGEGVAFHATRPLPIRKAYREDDIGLTATNDAGGGYVLAGLQAGEWVRYSTDCGNGGLLRPCGPGRKREGRRADPHRRAGPDARDRGRPGDRRSRRVQGFQVSDDLSQSGRGQPAGLRGGPRVRAQHDYAESRGKHTVHLSCAARIQKGRGRCCGPW